jgi:hypothetical protein
LTVNGFWTIGGNNIPFHIENLEIDPDGRIVPQIGFSGVLGGYVTGGTVDFENDELGIVRSFENGMVFGGTGVIGNGGRKVEGNWKIEGVSGEVEDEVR